jgi:hypothetical protein
MIDWRQSVLEPNGRTILLPIPYDKKQPSSVQTIGPITGNFFEIGVPAVCQAQKVEVLIGMSPFSRVPPVHHRRNRYLSRYRLLLSIGHQASVTASDVQRRVYRTDTLGAPRGRSDAQYPHVRRQIKV